MKVYQRMPLQMVQQGFQALVSAIKLERESSEDVVLLLHAAREQTKLVKAWQAFTAFAFARLGLRGEARIEFEDMAVHDFEMPKDTTWLGAMAMLAEVCAELGDAERASTLYERLLPFRELHAAVGIGAFTLGSIERFLALLSFARGDYETAISHFEAALKSNGRASARLFVAYTKHDYSRLLRRRDEYGDRERADALLESSAESARACGSTCLQRRIEQTLQTA
jgi:tetratricopeptide (TPR) repeat protein